MSTRNVVVLAGLMVAVIVALIGLSVLASNQVHHATPADPALEITAAQYDAATLGTREAVLQRRLGAPPGLPGNQELREVVAAFGATPKGQRCTFLRITGSRVYARLCFDARSRLAGKRKRTP
jgi:hypothetical protein